MCFVCIGVFNVKYEMGYVLFVRVIYKKSFEVYRYNLILIKFLFYSDEIINIGMFY